MADIIKVSTEELRIAVERYTAQRSELQVAYLQMSNAIRQLDASYDGDASETLKERFDQMYRNIEQTDAKVQDAITELARTAEIMDEVESGIQLAFGSLETGSSPFDLGGGSGGTGGAGDCPPEIPITVPTGGGTSDQTVPPNAGSEEDDPPGASSYDGTGVSTESPTKAGGFSGGVDRT